MLLQASKRLRKFFDSRLTNEKIWREITEDNRLEHVHQLTALNREAASALIRCEKRMELLSLGLTELPADVAEELAKYKGEKLFLNCVRILSPESARAIARFKGSKLAFCGLMGIDLPAMGGLSAYKGSLLLDGVESIAVTLKEGKRAQTVFGNLKFAALTLTRLKKPGTHLLLAMSRFRGQLKLSGISHLTGEEAEILSGFLGKALSLKGIETITPELLTLLSQYEGFLDLSGALVIDSQLLSAAASRKEGFSLFNSVVIREIEQFKKMKTLQDRQRSEEKWQQVRREEETRRQEEALLAELEAFSIPGSAQEETQNLEAEKPLTTEFEIVSETDETAFEVQIGQDVLDDIELNLNLEISRKRRRMNELLTEESANLSAEENAELHLLEREIGELNDKIKGALEILLERRELGAIVFNSSDDLAAYLQEAGAQDDENDALASIEEADLFNGCF